MIRRLLVVEDDERSRRLLVDVLGFHGFQVIATRDAASAIEAFGRDLPDAVLLDIQLPDMDGFELLGRLRAHGKARHIPALAVTASVMDVDRKRILAAGFDAYVPKPVDLKHLRRLLDQLLPAHP